MVSLRREFEIKEIVEKILKKNKITSPPIDLMKILKAENIEYYEEDLSSITDLESNTEALFLSDGDEKKIVLNTAIGERYTGRNRFTLAHEIGHSFLHAQDGNLYIAARRSGTVLDAREEEANKFAVHLLMPDSMVEEVIFQKKGLTVSNLAQMFDVSEKAMNRKLMELGLL